ncbi:MAG: BON domain-containing protein [Herpetosiphonaceae bacterium]|nr:BON domain-containing protein [Herpetosiphonaceae bacterium]
MSNRDQTGLHAPQDNLPLELTSTSQPGMDADDVPAALFANNPDETAYIDQSDVGRSEGSTMTDVYEGNADTAHTSDGTDDFDMLVERELRAGETQDSMEAVEEGLTYVPPSDPPMSLDPDGGTGHDLDDPEDDDDTTARIRAALQSDSSTIGLVSRLKIATIGSTVVVRGEVDDLDDTDNIVAVISEVPGVEAVRDETTVRGL